LDLLVILGIGVALAMDCFAISVATGIALKRLHLAHALRIALFFGGFQAIMPTVGFYAGKGVAQLISGWDHWVVFAVLAFIGGRMIRESFKIDRAGNSANILNLFTLFVLSIATSLDALAVGFSFALLRDGILAPALVIGMVTFTLSLVGMAVGERLGHFFERKIEIIGGLILVGIGVKILLDHLL
jgi:putative Mn2+ efflux pump MntP